VFVWDEKKRQANLLKHELDFEDAHIVYFAPDKATYPALRLPELRFVDIALAEFAGRVLALVYTRRGQDIRIISFRPASRRERRLYEPDKLGKG
jgi:uncharacterized DUF497 family protein